MLAAMIALALVAAMMVPCSVQADVAMVFSVHRHGARNLLPKTQFLADSDAHGGPELLPQGMRQCYNAGMNYRHRYINSTTCSASSGGSTPTTCLLRWFPSGGPNGDLYGIINQTEVGFNNYNTMFRSSELCRTVQSANSFLAAVFPPQREVYLPGSRTLQSPQDSYTAFLPTGEQLVPVFSEVDTHDDLIRTYTKCPKYNQALEQWYESEEFAAKATETRELRQRVGQAISSCSNGCDQNLQTSLRNWYNVWDAFNTRRTYRVGVRVPDADDGVTAEDFREMTALAAWLEMSKMRSGLTQALLGGPLLLQLAQNLANAANVVVRASKTGAAVATIQHPGMTFLQLVSYSAHYNTIMGVLSALKLDSYRPAAEALKAGLNGSSWLATGALSEQVAGSPKIPSLASMILFELHAPSSVGDGSEPSDWSGDKAELEVRLVVQDGPGTPYITLPLPCSPGTGQQPLPLAGAGACTLPDFLDMLVPLALDELAWCDRCQNDGADRCQSVQLRDALTLEQQRYTRLQDRYEELIGSINAPRPVEPNSNAAGSSPAVLLPLLLLPALLTSALVNLLL